MTTCYSTSTVVGFDTFTLQECTGSLDYAVSQPNVDLFMGICVFFLTFYCLIRTVK